MASIIGAIAITATIGGVLLQPAMAQSEPKATSLIQMLTDRFGLNKTEVDQVVTQYRSARMAQRQTEINAKLAQAVNDKKLTQSQADELKQLQQKWRNEKTTNWTELTREERQKLQESHRDEMHNWATKNNIDLQSILGFEGNRNGNGRGMGRLSN